MSLRPNHSLALLSLLLAAPLWAQEGEPPSHLEVQEPLQVVVPSRIVAALVSEKASSTTTGLLEALGSQLRDLPVRLVVERVPGFPALLSEQVELARSVAARLGAVSVFWFDADRPGQALVYVAEPGGGRVLVRALEATSAVERAEGIGVVVRGFTRAVLGGGRIGIEPPPALAPPPPPAASSYQLAFHAAYAGEGFAKAAPVRQGAEVGLSLLLHERLWLRASYRFLDPADTLAQGVRFRVDRHPAELAVGYLLSSGPFAAGGRLSWNLDYLTRAADAYPEQLVINPAGRTLAHGVAAMAHGSYAVGDTARLFIEAGAELLVNPVDYQLEVGGERQALMSLWRVRPRLLLGVSASVL